MRQAQWVLLFRVQAVADALLVHQVFEKVVLDGMVG